MENNKQVLFRKKVIEQISSPEQLTDYLRVTNPGIWAVLAAVILLLAGIFVWSATGTLETKAAVAVVVSDHTAQVVPSGSAMLEEGMPLRVSGQESRIAFVEADENETADGHDDVVKSVEGVQFPGRGAASACLESAQKIDQSGKAEDDAQIEQDVSARNRRDHARKCRQIEKDHRSVQNLPPADHMACHT